MTPLPLPSQTLAHLRHYAAAGQHDDIAILHLLARADKRDQDVAEFVDSYSSTIAAICRRLEALERGANDLPTPAAPVDDSPVADGDLPARVLAMCRQRNWSLDWTCRGDPKAEAADVLLVLMSITENAGIPWGDVLEQVAATCTQLENCGRYSGEEWTALVEDAKGTESDSPTAPADGLVERVAGAMGSSTQAAMEAGELPFGNAYAAIREIATWLDTRGQHGCSALLREEIDP
jgi:hypothetical protein